MPSLMAIFVLVIKAIKTRLESGGKGKFSAKKRTLRRYYSVALEIGSRE